MVRIVTCNGKIDSLAGPSEVQVSLTVHCSAVSENKGAGKVLESEAGDGWAETGDVVSAYGDRLPLLINREGERKNPTYLINGGFDRAIWSQFDHKSGST